MPAPRMWHLAQEGTAVSHLAIGSLERQEDLLPLLVGAVPQAVDDGLFVSPWGEEEEEGRVTAHTDALTAQGSWHGPGHSHHTPPLCTCSATPAKTDCFPQLPTQTAWGIGQEGWGLSCRSLSPKPFMAFRRTSASRRGSKPGASMMVPRFPNYWHRQRQVKLCVVHLTLTQTCCTLRLWDRGLSGGHTEHSASSLPNLTIVCPGVRVPGVLVPEIVPGSQGYGPTYS